MTPVHRTDIRAAAPEDALPMARVFAEAIAVKAGTSYGPNERAAWTARGSASRFAAMIDDGQNALLVAEADGAVVGVAGLRGCEVSLLYTVPDAAPGTGARLLAAIEGLARQSGLAGLTLTASRNAVSFYMRCGYAIVSLGSRPLPGGVSLPVCLMAKSLATP